MLKRSPFGPHERLLDAAAIHDIAADAIGLQSDTASKNLYLYFGLKVEWIARIKCSALSHVTAAAARFFGMFDSLGKLVCGDDFNGCLLLHRSADAKDVGHGIRVITRLYGNQ